MLGICGKRTWAAIGADAVVRFGRQRFRLFGNGRNWRSRSRRFDGVLHPQLLDQVHRLPGAALVSVGFGDDFRVEGIAQSGDRSCRLAIVIVLVVHLSGVFEESRVADGNAAAGNVQQFAFVEFKDIVARAADVAAARPLFLFLFWLFTFHRGRALELSGPWTGFVCSNTWWPAGRPLSLRSAAVLRYCHPAVNWDDPGTCGVERSAI